VSTSIGPDVVLLDPALGTGRIEKLLQAHPVSARAQILHLEVEQPAVPTPAQAVRTAA
jgi:hypothetical protein